MVANTITLCRLLLTFVVIVLLGKYRTLDIGLIAAIGGIFALDGIDGYIARKRDEASKFGEVLDTVADRIIENTFWIYFTTIGPLPLWVPITVMARGFITDGLQRFWGYPKMDGHTRPRTHASVVPFPAPPKCLPSRVLRVRVSWKFQLWHKEISYLLPLSLVGSVSFEGCHSFLYVLTLSMASW